MRVREKLKGFGKKHRSLLAAYRASVGKLKTKFYFDYQRKALQKNGLPLIGRISDALSRYGATYFLNFGTLLGVVRDGQLIEHDRDIDFGIYFDDIFTPEMLDRAMREIGLKRVHTYLFRGEVKEVTYKYGVTNIDFFRHEETETETMSYVFYRQMDVTYEKDNQYSVIRRHRVPIPGIRTIEISGYTFQIPENAEEYLECVYTTSWRTPDAKWTYRSNPVWEEFPGEYGIRIEA